MLLLPFRYCNNQIKAAKCFTPGSLTHFANSVTVYMISYLVSSLVNAIKKSMGQDGVTVNA